MIAFNNNLCHFKSRKEAQIMWPNTEQRKGIHFPAPSEIAQEAGGGFNLLKFLKRIFEKFLKLFR